MNIDPRANASHLYAQSLNRPQNGAAQEAGQSAQAAQNGADKVELNALEALRNEPEVRPDVVAKGRELLNDPNYPSKEIVDAIAKLIVPFSDDE